MVNYKRLAASLVIGLPFFVAACATTQTGSASIANETHDSVEAKIKDGVTTKSQILAMYGNPVRDFTDSNGREEYVYDLKSTTNRQGFRNLLSAGANLAATYEGVPTYGAGQTVGNVIAHDSADEKVLTVVFNGNVVYSHSFVDNPNAVPNSAVTATSTL
ncbi:MAG: hypothetical protein IIT54_00560 [Acetobacter sp.]|nr:hypothetical protein [Acetobacter sp.]